MIVYNVTYKVRWDIQERWSAWLQSAHIAAHLATGLFDSHRVFRLLEQDEEEGPTYVVQYFTTSLERYRQFMIEFAPDLQRVAWDKWGDGFMGFRTLMEEIN
ncbi:MAG: DUF4286 family protein [Chitinophagaceae bacterium]|nr:DUF4286 family protein [Chitinophagaceae bacterium]